MAVYTKISRKILEELLSNYEIGHLINFEEIAEGVENSNFKVITSKSIYILTIFEKRVSSNEVPFFVELMNHLYSKNYKCPNPIPNRNNEYIANILNKKCIFVSFIEGNWVKKIENLHCEQLGYHLANLHIATKDFSLIRNNAMGLNSWKILFNNFKSEKIEKYSDIYKVIEKELDILEKNWPKNLPSGVIHADLFQDNVFFKNDNFSGVIDFYFSCNDFYAYEIAICLNAWCFEKDQSFNTSKARLILDSYQKQKPLNEKEKEFLPILARGAAIRFLLSRLNDLIFHPSDAFVSPKDPNEYLKILNFHQHINSIGEYGLEN